MEDKKEVWVNIYLSNAPDREPIYWTGRCWDSEEEAKKNIDSLGHQYIKTIKIEI